VPAQDSGDSSGDDDDSSTGATIVSFLPLILIVVAVYFLLLRPRQRQMRQQRELQSGLEVGDEVMLTSGVYGFITGFETGSDVVWVEIDDDVQIRVSRAAVSGKVDTSGAAAAAGQGAATSADSTAGPVTSRRPTLKGGSKDSAGKPAGDAAAAPASGDGADGDESPPE
jgi:preprotein translocase subunit YajC